MTINGISVSVAVVTANRCPMLEACLASLSRGDYPISELLILDNASSDGTPDLVRSKYPRARYVRNERNMGLTHCHNQALNLFSADCVFLLDDDNEVAPTMLRLLVEHLYAPGNERLGIVVPVICQYQVPDGFELGGCRTSMWSGRTVLQSARIDARNIYHETKRVPNSTLISRACVNRFGVLDERFFSTLADEDYVRRMNRAGWVAHVVLAARVYHKVRFNAPLVRRAGFTNPARAYIIARNRTILIRRYARWYQFLVYILIWMPWYTSLYGGILLVFVRKWSYISAYVKGCADAWRYIFTGYFAPLDRVLSLLDEPRTPTAP